MGILMHYCYIDESGNSEIIISKTHNAQPVLAMVGLFIAANNVTKLTNDFIALKRKYYPQLFSAMKHDLEALLLEIKGSDIRTDIRKNQFNSRIVKHHFRFLDDVFALLVANDVKLVSRIWVKGIGKSLDDKSVYSITTQQFCVRFQKYLESLNSTGIMIADFRDPNRNSYVAHSVFTRKFKQTGDAFPLIREIPTFGISNNHAALQICDLLCSTIITPIAALKFCSGIIVNPHTHTNYDWIKNRYSKRLKSLQWHCKVNGQMYWGITANNEHDEKNRNLF